MSRGGARQGERTRLPEPPRGSLEAVLAWALDLHRALGLYLEQMASRRQYLTAVANVPAGAAATDYDGLFFIADAPCQIVVIRERHATAGSDAGAVTLMVKKVPSGTAKGAGTDTMAAGFNLKATADTIQTASLHATAGNYQLAAGDALGLVATGVLTAVDGVTLAVELKRI